MIQRITIIMFSLLVLLNNVVSQVCNEKLPSRDYSKYKDLQNDLLSCLGKSLTDETMKAFISKYEMKLDERYVTDKIFLYSNKFMEFRNDDQFKLTVENIEIKNNCYWLPYKLKNSDLLKNIKIKLGKPDIIDYRFNVAIYYDKLMIVNFYNIQDDNSKFTTISFYNNLKQKPKPENLKSRQNVNDEYLSDLKHKSFGYNSKWLVVKSNDLDGICKYFGANEVSIWRYAFELSQSYKVKGIFITPIKDSQILIHGWALPDIDKQIDFYKKLSINFEEVQYFANDIRTPFSWGLFKNGEVVRAFSEEYFNKKIDIGKKISVEVEQENKKNTLLHQYEEETADQDYRRNYRIFMAELVLKIAQKWSFDPREMSKFKLKEKVYINKNYR